MASSEGLLPQSVLRAAGDKLYERRKTAALEVEQIVKSLDAQGNPARIRSLVNKLVADFAFSPQANSRKGGLLCLAATAVGLADHNIEYLPLLVPPILSSFTDQ
ncbi:hypothetical protein WJX84_004974, partial [Apatococcus fuscideae]